MTNIKKDDITQQKKNFPWKKALLASGAFVVVVALSCIIFMFFRINSSVGRIFEGNALDAILTSEPLQKDTHGLTNVLIFGNSSDDPGHGGALLSDSIIVMSINQNKNIGHTLSIPRDLWVEYGRMCSNGSEGKINAYYQCVLRENNDEKQASRAFTDMVGSILNIPIQYYAEVNYGFVKDAVDAVGGVDVIIESDDPRGILDRNFDRKCPNGPYSCYYVKYENGPAYLDGEHALYLARARNAKDGYGLPQSNFDREANQQMILQALQEKAFSKGILINPAQIIALMDSLGNNIVTNVPAKQLRSMADVFQSLGSRKITSIPLNERPNASVTTGVRNGQSIVLPVAGLYNYTQLRDEIAKALAL